MSDDYWTEHAEIAMDEAKLSASPEQIQAIAGVIESAHEFFGQSMGHDVANRNWHESKEQEVKDLKQELLAERNKTVCKECRGKGWIIENFLERSSTSTCWKCHGDGRI